MGGNATPIPSVTKALPVDRGREFEPGSDCTQVRPRQRRVLRSPGANDEIQILERQAILQMLLRLWADQLRGKPAHKRRQLYFRTPWSLCAYIMGPTH